MFASTTASFDDRQNSAIVAQVLSLAGPGGTMDVAGSQRAGMGELLRTGRLCPADISVKSHDNGSRNPKAHLRNRVTEETVLKAPMIADPLGLYDCCGVSDGAAAAIVTTPEIARSLGKHDLISVNALQLAASNGMEGQHAGWDGSYWAGERQRAKEPVLGLTHNLGGFPHQNVCSVAIIGRHGA